MKANLDAGLEAALEQRRHKLDAERQVLAERELTVQHEAALLASAESRVRMVLQQIDAAQQPAQGVNFAVAVLGDLERLLQWCEQQVVVQRAATDTARASADEARGAVQPPTRRYERWSWSSKLAPPSASRNSTAPRSAKQTKRLRACTRRTR